MIKYRYTQENTTIETLNLSDIPEGVAYETIEFELQEEDVDPIAQDISDRLKHIALLLEPIINQIETDNQSVKGFYYNPTLTSVLGTHHAIHTTSGRVRFEGLPTSPKGLSAGDIYNDGGIIKIV